MADTDPLEFHDRIAKAPAAAPFLPMVHITEAAAFKEIVLRGEFAPTPCKVYREPLWYVFYGKPTYRVPRKDAACDMILGKAACCFVLDYNKAPPAHRIFPFDTGAYYGERYDDYMPSSQRIEDFELEPGADVPAKFVTAFYASNRHYYRGQPRKDLTFPTTDFISETLTNLINAKLSPRFDDRVASCEIQFAAPLKLSKETLIAAVIPDQLVDDTALLLQLQAVCRERPIVYEFAPANPGERTAIVKQKLSEFYDDQKLK